MKTIRWELRHAGGFHGYRKKDGPNMDGANRAAETQAALSKETLDWYKQQYAEQAPERERAAEAAHQASDLQLEIMQAQADQMKTDRDFTNSTFRPLEAQIVADAKNYDTPEKQTAAATAAVADVNTSRAAGRAATARANASMGVNPNSGRAAALDEQGDVMAAAASAGAANSARKGVETQGYARRMDAANLGRNIASSQGTSAQIAASAGTAGANTGGMALGQAQSATQMVGGGMAQAGQMNAQAGQMYQSIANTQAQTQGQTMGAVGSIAGAAIAVF